MEPDAGRAPDEKLAAPEEGAGPEGRGPHAWEDFAPPTRGESRAFRRKVVPVVVAVAVVVAATVALIGPWGPLDPYEVEVTYVHWIGVAGGSKDTSGFTVRGGVPATVSITFIETGTGFCAPGCGPPYYSASSQTAGFGVASTDIPVTFSGGTPPTNTTAGTDGYATAHVTVSTPWNNFDGFLVIDLNGWAPS